MKQDWQQDELVAEQTLLPEELILTKTKARENQLGFALLLKYAQAYSRFPQQVKDFPAVVIEYVAWQLEISPSMAKSYQWEERSLERYCQQIREIIGIREPQKEDVPALKG